MNEDTLTYPMYAYQAIPFGSGFGSTTAFGPRIRRDYAAVKRGVFDECCKDSCTMQELMAYCGN